MNLRKTLNISSIQQLALLKADEASILSKCDAIARSERMDFEETRKIHDDICPNCKTRKHDDVKNIVNKIGLIRGGGNINGSAFHVNGKISIDTYAINHCNVCGNEWEKFKKKDISETNILRVCLNYLAQLSQNPSHHKQFEWKLEAVKVFEGSYAETIFRLAEKEKKYLIPELNPELSLSKLRRDYKSVYDKSI